MQLKQEKKETKQKNTESKLKQEEDSHLIFTHIILILGYESFALTYM